MKPHRASAFADAEPLDRRGRRTPQAMLLRDERDKLLFEATRFYPGISQRETARRLRTALSRYREGRWRRDRTEVLCPPQHRGRLDEVMWRILRTRDCIPSERLIRLVLSRSS